MRWLEVTVNTTHEAADIVSDAFFSMGCQGVSIIDKKDVTDALKSNLYWDYVDAELLESSSDIVKVAGFFMEEEYGMRVKELRRRLDDIKGSFTDSGSLEITSEIIDDADWENNWKKYYKPIIVKNIQVIPEWLKDQKKDGLVTVYLDPGMAFGTGEHETTKMCLELMQDAPLDGKTVYDAGCGSGVLGIAAVLSGAAAAYLYDIDPTSVLTARKNAEKNNVQDKTEIFCADLLKEALGKNPAADIILANITADILIRLAEALFARLKDGGTAILSGVVDGRQKQVLDCYLKSGFLLAGELALGDWRAFKMTKPRI
ncbi:MAG: 50S ribosomal protein L11 methyltransferase [Clostridiales bacterium]|jgi:ribosomal protein L11 methyltransferase|nr:50S ribosomal protein L11 methyltransferase [Clostridiales bacterium]